MPASPGTSTGPKNAHQRPAAALFHNQLKALPDHQSSAVRERFFTASLGGALDSSLALRRRFVTLLVGGATWRGHVISRSAIDVTIEEYHETQAAAGGEHYWLDLVLTVNGADRIGVEAKLDAPEGVDAAGRRQIERYLKLKSIHAVAFVTAALTGVNQRVWKHRDVKYLAPKTAGGEHRRRHFLWSDFYPDVKAVADARNPNPLVVALLGLFDHRGLQPAHPLIGDLGARIPFDEAPEAIRQNRTRLQEAMRPVQTAAAQRGWAIHSKVRNNGTFFVYPSESDPRDWQVWVSSNHVPGVLRVWFSVESAAEKKKLAEWLDRKLSAALTTQFGWDVMPTVLTPPKAMHHSVEVRLPYASLLRGLRTRKGVAARASTAVNVVLDLADAACAPQRAR